MADEADTKILNQVMEGYVREFDTTHLQKLYEMFYDRWNWDTGFKADKDLLNIIEEELEQRGTSMSGLRGKIDFVTGDGTTVSVKGGTTTKELELSAEKVSMSNPMGSMPYELLDCGMGNLQLSKDLKEAVVRAIMDEMQYGNVFHNGYNLKTAIENILGMNLGWRVDELEKKVNDERS